jgi:copper(I)-binding protein
VSRQEHRAGRTRAAALLTAGAAAIALSACAAGTDAVTNQSRTTTNSVTSALGAITLSNVYLAGPADTGSSAQLVSALFNGGQAPDSLVSLSSPVAAGARPPANSTLTPGGGAVFLPNGAAPTLDGLKRDLRVGQTVPVTFTFARAGSLTLDVPVELPAPLPPGMTAVPVPSVSASASPAASVSASATASPGAAASAPAATATPAGTAPAAPSGAPSA